MRESLDADHVTQGFSSQLEAQGPEQLCFCLQQEPVLSGRPGLTVSVPQKIGSQPF